MTTEHAVERILRSDTSVSRRHWMAYAAALASIPSLGRTSHATRAPSFQSDPFTLGVASGDPDESSVVLWTRLAPQPFEPGGGMGVSSVEVQWELAADDSMRSIVAAGKSAATAQLGHSVHVEVPGLHPNRWYWYRFRAGDAVSPIGRTRTLPESNVLPDRLRFAVASCQNFEQGLYTAYEQMSRDDLDLVFHLGDYIYEYEAGRNGKVRTHLGAEIQSLDDYRIRYAQYRADPLLKGMHAGCPWFLTWDDHEFDNNYAADISEERGVDPIEFLVRRANAYQAYYEMMPLRRRSLPSGSEMRIYRRASFGRLADFQILDTRQYRSDQPNGDRLAPLNASAMVSSQSALGRRQYNWLCQRLITSQAVWNVLAQQIMMGMVGRDIEASTGEPLYSMDQWPGYTAERMRLLRFMEERKIRNPIVLTGDIHSNWVNELRIDDRRPEQPIVGTEFVATSISSGGNGPQRPRGIDALLAANPCVKFHNGERGYIRCSVTPDAWQSDFMVVDDVLTPGGKTFERASFVVESGDARVHPA